jgi:hypothetical protein
VVDAAAAVTFGIFRGVSLDAPLELACGGFRPPHPPPPPPSAGPPRRAAPPPPPPPPPPPRAPRAASSRFPRQAATTAGARRAPRTATAAPLPPKPPRAAPPYVTARHHPAPPPPPRPDPRPPAIRPCPPHRLRRLEHPQCTFGRPLITPRRPDRVTATPARNSIARRRTPLRAPTNVATRSASRSSNLDHAPHRRTRRVLPLLQNSLPRASGRASSAEALSALVAQEDARARGARAQSLSACPIVPSRQCDPVDRTSDPPSPPLGTRQTASSTRLVEHRARAEPRTSAHAPASGTVASTTHPVTLP